MFPERADRGTRWFLALAVVLSLLVHAGGALVARWWWPEIARSVARVLPKPAPTPEIVALSDAIRIEKRPVVRESHRSRGAPSRRPQPKPRPQPRVVARVPELARIPVPTLPPVPSVAPTTEATPEPTFRPRQHATIHRVLAVAPRVRPTAEPTVDPKRTTESKSDFAQQLQRYQAQWSRTIADAQRSLTDTPRQSRPPARMPQTPQYEAIMAGTPAQFLAAFQGDCVSLQGPMPDGALHAYYLRCFIRYNDGYFETVSFPWIYQFPPRRDPFDLRVNPDGKMTFPPQGPPPGFALPPHFALSRAVCAFFKSQCADLIQRETENGNQPVTGGP